MTVSLLEPRRVPETCGQRWRAGPCAARLARFADLSGWAVTMLSGRLAAENLTAVVTKSALILPYLTVAASLTVCDRYPEEDLMNVEISGVTRRFGRNLAVAGVDVATGPGVFGLLGPNGAGKTTLLRMMATAIPPSAGTLRLLGRDPGSYGPRREIRRRLGYLPQNLGYYPGFTVVELIEYFALLKEMPPARSPPPWRLRSSGWISAARPGRSCAPCPAGCCAGPGSPRRSSTSPPCCCSTSRPPGWTRSSGSRSVTCCATSASGPPWWSPPTWSRTWAPRAPRWR